MFYESLVLLYVWWSICGGNINVWNNLQAMKFLLECRASEGVTTEERFLMFLAAFQQASRLHFQTFELSGNLHSTVLEAYEDSHKPLEANYCLKTVYVANLCHNKCMIYNSILVCATLY